MRMSLEISGIGDTYESCVAELLDIQDSLLMKRIVHMIAILGIVLPAFMSCKTISSFLSNDETVAEAGNAKLYRSELNALIPKGIQSEDSVRLARQYINAWALDQLFLTIAQEQLSKASTLSSETAVSSLSLT